MTSDILPKQLGRYQHSPRGEIQDEIKTWARHEIMEKMDSVLHIMSLKYLWKYSVELEIEIIQNGEHWKLLYNSN